MEYFHMSIYTDVKVMQINTVLLTKFWKEKNNEKKKVIHVEDTTRVYMIWIFTCDGLGLFVKRKCNIIFLYFVVER